MKKIILLSVIAFATVNVQAQISDQTEPNKVKFETSNSSIQISPNPSDLVNQSQFKMSIIPTNGSNMFLETQYKYIGGGKMSNTLKLGSSSNYLELRELPLTTTTFISDPHLYSNGIVTNKLESSQIMIGVNGFRAPTSFRLYTTKAWFEEKVVVGIYNGHTNMSAEMSANPNYSMFVGGGIMTEEVNIKLKSNWADYVFAPEYNLLSLEDTEKFISENKHLPNVPSANEIADNGVSVGEMSVIQMEKIEELTLHLIQLNKEKQDLENEVKSLNNRLKNLENMILNK